MPSFGDVGAQPLNQLFSLTGTQQAVNQNALSGAQAQAAQQDLSDRAQLRGLAPGLATADPNAMATASTLGPYGSAAVGDVDATIKSRQMQSAFSSGLATQVASSISSMPDEQSASTAYPMLRQSAINSGMNPALLPEQFPGRAGMVAYRNTAIPVGTAVELQANAPRVAGQDNGPLWPAGVSPSGGVCLVGCAWWWFRRCHGARRWV